MWLQQAHLCHPLQAGALVEGWGLRQAGEVVGSGGLHQVVDANPKQLRPQLQSPNLSTCQVHSQSDGYLSSTISHPLSYQIEKSALCPALIL